MIRMITRFAAVLGLTCSVLGCDSAMIDATPKPEVTGAGPKEPDAPGRNPGPGKVDLGEVGPGGPLETKVQEGPSRPPRAVASPDGKAP